MPRKHKRGAGSRPYAAYGPVNLERAIKEIEQGQRSLRKVSAKYKIPLGTLSNRMNFQHCGSVGRKTIFSPEEEATFIDHIMVVAEWGFPLDQSDPRYLVKSYLDISNRNVPAFKDNLPGTEWASSFCKRHKEDITIRNCQNLTRGKSRLSPAAVNSFFDNFETSVAGVPARNIFNYDETSLVDDPGVKRCIFRRGVKYPERVMNCTKSSMSVMFCGNAEGRVLPPYTVYKAEHLWDSWVIGGPDGSRYNRSRKGWFDTTCFTDWFESTLLPHAKTLKGPVVLVGDNLQSHFSTRVLDLAKENNIKFVCLPPNSTHVLQPLDVAFFSPLKKAWRSILDEWKRKYHFNIVPKSHFPQMLATLFNKVCEGTNLKSGFRKCGLYPLDRKQVLVRIPDADLESQSDPQPAVSSAMINLLSELRFPDQTDPETKQTQKTKSRVAVEPGKSISAEDIKLEKKRKTSILTDGAQKKRKISKKIGHELDNEQKTCDDEKIPHYSLEEMGPRLAKCLTYSDLEKVVDKAAASLQPLCTTMKEQHTVVSSKSIIDRVSLKIMPKDARPNYFPVETIGDGNCFPRSLSKLVYGDEQHHGEMRMRLVCEAVQNKQMYLNDTYLSKGAKYMHKNASLPMVYAQYSEHYQPGRAPLTDREVAAIYEKEVLQLVKPGSFMGIWQFFQAANVLGKTVHSHYPENTNMTLRKDLGRTFHPIKNLDDLESYSIMWTYCGGDTKNRRPSHFVPMLPLHVNDKDGLQQLVVDKTSDMMEDVHDLDAQGILLDGIESMPTINVTGFACGDYVLTKHGSELIPAAVTSLDPLSVGYFTKTSDGLWAPADIEYRVLESDLKKTLDAPTLVPHGTRMFYKFNL